MSANTCLPCFTGNHDWCVVDTKLIGMDHTCACTDPRHNNDTTPQPVKENAAWAANRRSSSA